VESIRTGGRNRGKKQVREVNYPILLGLLYELGDGLSMLIRKNTKRRGGGNKATTKKEEKENTY